MQEEIEEFDLGNSGDGAKFKNELHKYEKELKEEIEKTNKGRIEAEKKDYENRLKSFKENVKIKYEDLLKSKKDEIKKDYDKKVLEMEKEEEHLK